MSQDAQQHGSAGQNGVTSTDLSSRSYLKSASISASKCVAVKDNKEPEVLLLCCLKFVYDSYKSAKLHSYARSNKSIRNDA